MNRPMEIRPLTLLALVAAFLLGGLVIPDRRQTVSTLTDVPPVAAVTPAAAPAPAPLPVTQPDAIADAAEKAGPAVVRIVTVTEEHDPWEGLFGPDPFFGGGTRRQTGTGSGVLISRDGYILTNEHVIAGADAITVSLADGRKVPGNVVGSDPPSDLAVVKINAPNLPTPPRLSTARLRPGQWAIAIGNPYGLEHTVTLGVISATNRPMQIQDRTYDNLIQTDCAINPGNSGGPLLNINGEVIGINTAILANAQGLGFAIPIGFAKSVADEIIRYGKVKRPWTGLIVVTLTPELAMRLGMPRTRGAIVYYVEPNSPAWDAGLERGDLILEVDGQPVTSGEALMLDLKKRRIGDRVKLLVQRGDRRGRTELRVGEAP